MPVDSAVLTIDASHRHECPVGQSFQHVVAARRHAYPEHEANSVPRYRMQGRQTTRRVSSNEI
jgi:hypothetical protein